MKRIRLPLEGDVEEWVDDDGCRGWQRFVNGEWIVCRDPRFEIGIRKPKPKPEPKPLLKKHFYAKDHD